MLANCRLTIEALLRLWAAVSTHLYTISQHYTGAEKFLLPWQRVGVSFCTPAAEQYARQISAKKVKCIVLSGNEVRMETPTLPREFLLSLKKNILTDCRSLFCCFFPSQHWGKQIKRERIPFGEDDGQSEQDLVGEVSCTICIKAIFLGWRMYAWRPNWSFH